MVIVIVVLVGSKVMIGCGCTYGGVTGVDDDGDGGGEGE